MSFEINSRVKELRKAIGLSQESFGNNLGLTRGWVTNIELNKKEIEPLKIDLICRTYNVNSDWLKYGQGEMFEQLSKDEEIAKFVAKILNEEEESFKRRFIEMLVALSPDEWEILEQAIEIIKKRG